MPIRGYTLDDLDSICAVWNGAWPNMPKAEDVLRKDLQTLEERFKSHFLIAEHDGETVGIAEIFREIGSFHPQRWTLHIVVAQNRRGQGMGKALYEQSVAYIQAHDPISIETMVREDDPRSLRFVAERGFRERKRDFESLLTVADLDESLLAEVEAKPLAPGLTFRSLAELDSPNFRQAFHRLFEEVRVDTPRSEPPTPLTLAFFTEHVIDDPSFLKEATFFAMHEEDPIGFSGIYQGHTPGWLDQWLTAVRRSWRGHGIATHLKVQGFRWAARNGFTTIRTDNDTRNAPMLAINDRFGFKRLPALVSMHKDLSVSS